SESKIDAMVKLADCYLQIKDYRNAELFYKKAIESGKVETSTHYNYATVLKNNNHYPEALDEFNKYLALSPNDEKAKNAIKYCREIKAWQSLPKEYEAVNLTEINTVKSEFSPVVYEGKLVFVSEQNPDIINYEQYDFNGKPYLNVFFTELKNEIPTSSKKAFSGKINTSYHDGPVCFNKEQNILYLTRVNYIVNKKNKNFVNRAKLYISEKSGKSWSTAKPFTYNSDDYSVAHPSISEDGSNLFFSSDMPGGFGGMDIWVCKKGKDGWEKPVNLGPDINTPGNEEFPFVRKDGMLFFSSDGLAGFGGMDIFSCKQIAGKWILNRNEGLGINSFADDFGIYFIDNSKGYISSNRDGSVGSDDIYKFTFSAKLISLDGTVLKSQDIFDPVKNIKVFLEDEGGTHIKDTRTNDAGYFRFDNLPPDKKYMVKIDETDVAFNGQKHFYYADSHNQIMRVTVVNEKGEKHVFRNLPVDGNSLPELTIPDDITLGGNLLYGENPSSPVANKQITLKDGSGNVIEQVTTNAFGSFVFSKLPPDENYILELSELDGSLPADAKIILTNKSGKEIKVVRADAKGGFKFSLLSSDNTTINELKVSDSDLLMDLTGKLLGQDKVSLEGAKIYLMDEKGNPVDTVLTDEIGKFEFKKLEAGRNYMVNIDENDARLNGMDKVFIADLKGSVVRELIRNKLKGFSFNLLESEKTILKQIYVDDPWLEVLDLKNKKGNEQITIVENVYYGLNEFKFNDDGRRVMDKVVQIMKSNANLKIEISSHTDSRAADKFNLTLSQKRAKFAVDYIISKGIEAKRLSAVGYGESKLINKCGNNVTCTEEEHAQNRRTEFKIIDTAKK
ncbi:MAG TPA: SpaA isopeptide-forming pilin-related protein, partial [Bacteroidia bacterium]|nr:SpaA isopeptide-forming pilin-related protein [Bacteroidia bacterium]